MPLRPCALLPYRLYRANALWTCSSCLARTSRPTTAPPPLHHRQLLPSPSQTLDFHASTHRPADTPTHYDILELQPSATPADIKRQFYALSKKHHPDHNPSDPTASTRFVAISEAYHVLSIPEKRAQYDVHIGSPSPRAHARAHHAHTPSGSHFGSRPASGLNKKRSTFRGPPPSFYKAGGYGKHGAKRAEYAHHQHEGAAGDRSPGAESYGGFGEGFGPGQAETGNDVPHFDDRTHKRTHETVYEHISARRRRERDAEIPKEFDRGGILANFLIVSGVVAIAAAATNTFSNGNEGSKKAQA